MADASGPNFDPRCAGKTGAELGTEPLGGHTRSSEEAGANSAATPTTACRGMKIMLGGLLSGSELTVG